MNTADESLPPFSIHPHSSAGQMNGRIHTFAVVISGPIWCTVLPCSPSHHPSLPLISTVLQAIPRHIHHLPTSIYLPYLPYYPLDVCILSTTP